MTPAREQFVIDGSRPLKGEIEVYGAKNAAFPLLAATILTPKDCIIKNLPLIEDVFRTIEILQSIGAKTDWVGKRALKVNTRNLDPLRINKDLVLRLRGSVLFFGPLLARFGTVSLPQPGGCIIGARPIDTHLDAFSQLGVKVSAQKTGFHLAWSGKLRAKEVILNEFSVTATENVLLFASGLKESVTLKIADLDYQVQELMRVLQKMGAKIKTGKIHEIQIEGAKRLKGFEHELICDPIEAGTFMLLGIAARGNLLIKNAETRFLELFMKKLKTFGASFEVLPGRNRAAHVRILPVSPRRIVIEKIQSFIYPGIHSDLQSPFGVLATQTKGSTLLHDPLYEGRLKYLEELIKMGAEIYFADPHRAIINGPTPLYGTDLATFDLRGGAALVLAALIAQGRSTISNVYQVDRGYEKIEERLQKIGADIKRVSRRL